MSTHAWEGKNARVVVLDALDPQTQEFGAAFGGLGLLGFGGWHGGRGSRCVVVRPRAYLDDP